MIERESAAGPAILNTNMQDTAQGGMGTNTTQLDVEYLLKNKPEWVLTLLATIREALATLLTLRQAAKRQNTP